MKVTMVVGFCIALVLAGCRKPATGDIIRDAQTRIRSAALESVSAKYPGINTSTLKFESISIQVMRDGSEAIFVGYIIPDSTVTRREGNIVKATTKAINVRMSPVGEVQIVSEGSNEETYNVAP